MTDLGQSEYNVLWHDDEPWIIDVGQEVKTAHPNAQPGQRFFNS